MYKNAKPLFLICETPLHVGSGSDLGIVDLPIQRERHTNFPKIEASSLKGALREAFESAFKSEATHDNRLKVHRAFGYDKDGILSKDKTNIDAFFGNDTQFSGALALTDARLLLFPVKSLYGVFAWITCPRVIKKFMADLGLSCTSLPFLYDEKKGITPNRVPNTSRSLFDKENRIYLEEFVFTAIEPEDKASNLDNIANWLSEKVFTDMGNYWKTKVKTDIVVLDDNDFRDFVTLATEVITRTKINNATGTVQDGALFSEEYLPAESVLYSLAMFSDEFRNDANKLKAKKENSNDADGVLEFFESGLTANNNIVQVGANATLGKGIIKTKFVKEVPSV